MKKYIRISLLVIVALLSICIVLAISKMNEKETKEQNPNAKRNITISLTNTDITSSTEEIEFTITNNENKNFCYAPDSYIQKKNENWEDVEFLDFAGRRESQNIIYGKQTRDEIIPIKEWYGSLSPGEYRIVIEEGEDSFYYCNFKVTE